MNRGDIKSRDEEKDEIGNHAAQPITVFIEADQEVLSKLFTAQPYTKEDMVKSAKCLLPQSGFSYDDQFQIFESAKEIDQKVVESKKPVFCVFGKPSNRWVLFCVLQKKDTTIVLFKDSSGCKMSAKLEDVLKKRIGKVEIVNHKGKDQEENQDYGYGPVCLRNLKIFLDGVKDNPDKFVKGFLQQQFFKAADLDQDKFRNVIKLTNEIATNKKFTTALKGFIDYIHGPLGKVSTIMEKYNKFVEEEMKKEKIDYKKIEEVRKKCLTRENIDKISGFFTNDDGTKQQLDIQKNFPEEMEKLQNILHLLNKTEVDNKFFEALQNISTILKINYENMKFFYHETTKDKGTSIEEELTATGINDIVKNLPKMKKFPADSSTPFDELLSDIVLGMDQEQESHQIEDKEELEEKYHLVKSKYSKWKNRNLEEINTWAKKTKGRLGSTDEDICEAIAVMDRTLNLLTGGHRLRDTQILSVLIFLHNQEHQGRLCQIQTGEGKTIIVSLLAVVKALQGHKVDVITSNSLLAADGVKETETFYHTLNLTVSTNNPAQDGANESKIGYTADVLYGTISNFQFDYLKDTFEGFTIRKDRPFQQVILDEVDSMLVDNGGHIAKLAAPYPGMECLRYIYIKIWQELYKAEESFVEETQTDIKHILDSSLSEEKKTLEYEKLLQRITQSERQTIKEKIIANNPNNVPLIPTHLKEYVTSKMDTWIKNALHAKYNCHEHQQYRIMTNDSGEKVVTPVDYLNTGVTMKNTIWSNGLHQFVQLKHNLYLTFESLTSSFISNIGYIKNYEDKNIFGLTGTLGSRAEQELLSHIYNVNYAKLPTYKEKKFAELPGMVVEDGSWATKLTLEVMEKIEEERAILVIFETEQDLLTVEKNLKILQNEDFRIRTYANEDNAKEIEEKVKIGDIILATNIAGRGTNFRTEKSLEEKGGLHVCVGFLPCNLRVEGQAFGRTSRQGNNGTAQLIIRQSEVDELETSKDPDFNQIKSARDDLEKERLKQINDVLVKELNFKDELFSCFAYFYRNLKKEKRQREDMFVLNDLKEFWAFWLEKKNFNAKNIANTTPQKEFESFKDIIANQINHGVITHNPFYSVALAEYYIENDEKDKALKGLNHALQINGSLSGAHLKLFEVTLLKNDQVKKKVVEGIGKVFGIKVKGGTEYRKQAIDHLEKAKGAVAGEIKYIREHLLDEGLNPDFEKIVNQGENQKNSFLKHISSRLTCLRIHQQNIEGLLEEFQNYKKEVTIGGKAVTSLETLQEGNSQLSEFVTNFELNELQSIGLDALYCLREIPEVPEEVIKTVRGEILAGVTLLGIGISFPPAFPVVSGTAADLISGAIIEMVMQILVPPEQFDSKNYMKGKFISYGKTLVSLGFSAAIQSVRILDKAIKFCQKLSKFLRTSKRFQTVCKSLATVVDKMEDYLKKLKLVAEFSKLSKLDQLSKLEMMQVDTIEFEKLGGLKKLKELQDLEKLGKLKNLGSMDLLVDFAQKTGKSVIKRGIVQDKVIKPLIAKACNKIFDFFVDEVTKALQGSIRKHPALMEKLQTTNVGEINATVDQFIETGKIKKLIKKFAPNLLNMLKSKLGQSRVTILTLSVKTVIDVSELVRYSTEFASELEKNLKGGHCSNNVNVVIDEICTKVAKEMLSLTKAIFKEGKELVTTVDKVKHPEDGKDSYSVLGLKSGAEFKEVTKRFRVLALMSHPDKNPDDNDAKRKFQKISAAYKSIVDKN